MDETMRLLNQIKRDGRKALKNNWAFPIFMLIVMLSVYFVFAFLSQVFYIIFRDYLVLGYTVTFYNGVKTGLSDCLFNAVYYLLFTLLLFILPVMCVGMKRWYLKNILNKHQSNTDFLFYFGRRNFLRTVVFQLNKMIRMFLWAFFLLLPGAACMTFANSISQKVTADAAAFPPVIPFVFLILGILLFVFGLVGLLFASYRYLLADYLFIQNPRKPGMWAIRQSRLYAKGHYRQIFFFQLSFLPYFLLCLLVVPVIFVFPYYQSCFSVLAQCLITANQRVPNHENAAGQACCCGSERSSDYSAEKAEKGEVVPGGEIDGSAAQQPDGIS